MSTGESGSAHMHEGGMDALERVWATPRGFRSLSAVNQTPIGKRYLVTAFTFFILGGLIALIMRTQLIVPDNDLVGHDLYNQMFTMHGTTMLFLFAVPILEGFAVYLLAPMIGARDLAFPRLSAFGYWCFLFGGVLLYSSFLFDMVPDAGWTMYTPLSSIDFSPGKAVDFWLLGITLVEIGSITAAAEIAVSVLKCRAPGMSLNRMPLFAWYMLVVSFMILFGFPPLIMGDALLEIERSLDWPFFDPSRGGDPLLWQHLFWIFGHPEVYIIFLPAAGFVSMILATFCQRPTVGYSWLVVSAVGTGFVSFGLWVHHMFTTGIPIVSMSFFSAASMTVAIFAGIQVFAWLATLWKGKPILKSPMLFVAGFIFLFVAGGLTGVMLAVIPFDWQAHSSYFLVAHFHYVLVGGMVFPLFAAFHYWFPTFTGRMLSERLGKLTFWLLFVGFNTGFFPMHISGLKGMPRRVYTYPEGMWEWENLTATLGVYVIGIGVLLFLVNVARSLRHGEKAGFNPWNAGTLEWAARMPMAGYNFRSIPTVDDAYPLWRDPKLVERMENEEFILSEAVHGKRLQQCTTPVKGDLEFVMIQAKPDFGPLLAALAVALAMIGFLVKLYWLGALGIVALVAALLWWLWRLPQADAPARDAIEKELKLETGASAGRAFGWWGTCTAVAGDASVFVSLLFAYFYLWSSNTAWPPGNADVFNTMLAWLSTGALLAGSALMFFATRVLPRASLFAFALVASFVAMLVHVVAQFVLILQSGLSPELHAYSAMVYTLAGYQVLHSAIALLMAGFTLAWTLVKKSRDDTRALIGRNTALFWHYTVAMGMIVNAVLYFRSAAA